MFSHKYFLENVEKNFSDCFLETFFDQIKKIFFFWGKKIDFENALPSNPIDPSVL